MIFSSFKSIVDTWPNPMTFPWNTKMTLCLLYVLDSTNDIKNVLFDNAEVFYVFYWSVNRYVLQKKWYFKIVSCITSGKVVGKRENPLFLLEVIWIIMGYCGIPILYKFRHNTIIKYEL